MRRCGSRRTLPSGRSWCGANQAMSVATKALESEGARAYTPLFGLGISVWQRSRVRHPDNVFAPSYIVRGEGRAVGFVWPAALLCEKPRPAYIRPRRVRRFPPPWSVGQPSTRRRCSSRISSAMLVQDSRTSSANGAAIFIIA